MDRTLATLGEIVEAGRADPPEASLRAAKRMLLDSLGCALGGYHERVPAIIRSVAAGRPASDGSPVFGRASRVHPDLAAFANSVMIRFLDYNDTFGSTGGVGHPSDYIPAALVRLSDREISGREALASVLVGYEIFCRLTDATQLGVEQIDHVLNGAVASAAIASVANGFSAEVTRHSMSLAATANLALQATRLGTLSMWKGCAAGNACRNGVFAAELAAAGITGPDAPFEGRGGLYRVTGRDIDHGALADGAQPAIDRCHVKRYPSGYFSQGAIEAAIGLHPALDGRAPAAVEVGTFEFGKRVMAGDEEKWHPTNRETADHSIPYVVACALARGSVTRRDLDASELDPPEIRRLLDVLTVEVDPECVAAWPEACLNKVTVRFTDGSVESGSIRYYRGHAKNPMDDHELEGKFREQAEPVLGPDETERLCDTVWRIDESNLAGLFAWTA